MEIIKTVSKLALLTVNKYFAQGVGVKHMKRLEEQA
jgi:hypothetical protein